MTRRLDEWVPQGWVRRLSLFWASAAVLFVIAWGLRPRLELPASMLVPSRLEMSARPPCAEQAPPPTPISFVQKVPGSGFLLHHEDSWKAMRAGLTRTNEHPGEALYAPIFATCVKFQYPPSSLLSFDLARSLFGAGVLANPILNSLSLLFFGAMIAAIWWLFTGRRQEAKQPAEHLLPVLFALTYYPALKAIELGQIQTWLNAGFAFGVLLYLSDKRSAAGIVFGVMATIKPQMALMLPWALLRRDFVMSRSMAATGFGLGILGLIRYGLEPHVEYLNVVRELSRHGESYHANQSVNGLLLRLLHLGPNEHFEFDRFAPYHPLVHRATTWSGLALMALALWIGRREIPSTRLPALDQPDLRLLDISLAGLCFTMASPIAWEHHYGFLPVAYAAAALALLSRPRGVPLGGAWTLLGLSWALTAPRYGWTAAFAQTRWNFVQSHLFFGALLLLGLLTWLRLRIARHDDAQQKQVAPLVDT